MKCLSCSHSWKRSKLAEYVSFLASCPICGSKFLARNDLLMSLVNLVKAFGNKKKYLPKRDGERYASALTNMNLSNRVYRYFGKIDLKDYIRKFREIEQ